MQKSRGGFTLIELLVVIAIIGVLSTMAVIAVREAQKKAKNTKAINTISEIRKAIDVLLLDTDKWPGNQEKNQISSVANNEICGIDEASSTCTTSLSDGTSGLVSNSGIFNNWNGPYMKKIPLDPWGHEYFFDTDYRIDSNGDPCGCGVGVCMDVVAIGSYGPDGLGAPTGGAGAYGCDDVILVIYK